MTERQQLLELHALFRHLIRMMTKRWNELMLEEKVTISQFRLLVRLNESGPQKVSDLAEWIGVTSGAVTGMSDKLIRSGYAERRRDDRDRRVVYLAVTDEGRAFVDKMMSTQREMVATLFGRLPDEDVDHLKRIFNELLKQAEPMEKE